LLRFNIWGNTKALAQSHFNTTPCYGSTTHATVKTNSRRKFQYNSLLRFNRYGKSHGDQGKVISIQLLVTVQLARSFRSDHLQPFQYNSLLRFNLAKGREKELEQRYFNTTPCYGSTISMPTWLSTSSGFQYNSLLRFNFSVNCSPMALSHISIQLLVTVQLFHFSCFRQLRSFQYNSLLRFNRYRPCNTSRLHRISIQLLVTVQPFIYQHLNNIILHFPL